MFPSLFGAYSIQHVTLSCEKDEPWTQPQTHYPHCNCALIRRMLACVFYNSWQTTNWSAFKFFLFLCMYFGLQTNKNTFVHSASCFTFPCAATHAADCQVTAACACLFVCWWLPDNVPTVWRNVGITEEEKSYEVFFSGNRFNAEEFNLRKRLETWRLEDAGLARL